MIINNQNKELEAGSRMMNILISITMIRLAFAIAASANFPILFFSMFWEKLSTRGALAGGWVGLITAVTMVILGPIVWVDILGNEQAIFPYKYPALFSMSAGILCLIVVSLLDKSKNAEEERGAFSDQFVRSMTGVGAEQASEH